MRQLDYFQFSVCKFALAQRLTSGKYLQEGVLSGPDGATICGIIVAQGHLRR